jgi:phosphate transport system substrate-binding protein
MGVRPGHVELSTAVSNRKGIALHLKRLASVTCATVFAGSVLGVGAASASAATLTGAGSTLVAPIEVEWAAAWGQATGNSVNYSPVGSGTGEKDIAAGQVDFGASDAPLAVYPTAPSNLVQIPWALTATGVSYHLSGVRSLHLTGPVLAAIYLGQITNWSDPQIKRLNPGVNLPNLAITVFWRSDGSGDTYAFTRYLSDVSSAFNSKVGSSTTVTFPVGQGAKGNTGMASAVAGTNGAIAYIAVSYMINDNLPAVAIKNAAGRYVKPNLSAIEAAAAVVHSVPGNNQLTIVNPPKRAKSAYVISTYTYIFVPTNAGQGSLLKSFVAYAIGQGQSFGPRLDFAPLPQAVRAAANRTLGGIS